ncbi:MAG: hypothetical protein KatS3mg024_1039 [Armatimonadota bacterium]|nr:MAG: hypothetical protein KatS3mg024_1039 [Armatimonadota bacterium]
MRLDNVALKGILRMGGMPGSLGIDVMISVRMARARMCGLLLAGCLVLVLLAVGRAWSAGEGGSVFVPGQIMVKLKASVDPSEIEDVAASLGARVAKDLPVRYWYLLESLTASADVAGMVSRALLDPRVVAAEPNYYLKKMEAIPNDPYWDSLWGMRMIRMPRAWAIQKGSANIRVAVIDDGVYAEHPDLQGRVLPGYDCSGDDADPTPEPGTSHGTHVAGTIAAQGDNGIGVVGVCWNGVRIIPLKIFPQSSYDNLIEALDIAQNGRFSPPVQRAHIINMSIGGPFSQAADDKMAEVAASGILMVSAAGNDAGPVAFPASSQYSMAVSSLNRMGTLATYSNFGPEIDIAAPGGQTSSDAPNDPGGIFSTVPTDSYESFQGTSMAAPHVAGAAALLMSAGMSASLAREALLNTATPLGIPRPNNLYGYGVLNVEKALQYPVSAIHINNPREGDVISTLRPLFEIRMPGVSLDSVSVYVDGETAIYRGSPADARVSDFSFNPDSGELVFSWQFTYTSGCPESRTDLPAKEGHRLLVTAGSSGGSASASRQVTFSIQPKVLYPGDRLLFSFPFAADSADPASVLGTPLYRLARSVTSMIPPGSPFLSYAFYNFPGLVNDPEASLKPQAVYVEEVYGSSDTLPRGLGYWLEYRDASPKCLLAGKVVDHRYLYEVDLKSGWNQIGNPYPFPVPGSALRFRYMGTWLSAAQAIDRGWISSLIYRYQDGEYRSVALLSAMLEPWEGYWIRVRRPSAGVVLSGIDDPRATMTIILSPVRQDPSNASAVFTLASRSAAGGGAALSHARGRVRSPRDRRRIQNVANGWEWTFSVRQGDAPASRATLGMSAAASDGYDAFDVELPPPADYSAVAGFAHSDWGADSGLYSRDIRSAGNEAVWTLRIDTYQAGDVQVEWGNTAALVRVFEITLTDLATGETIPLAGGRWSFRAPAGQSSRELEIRITRKGF